MPSGCRLLPGPGTQWPGPPGCVSALSQRQPCSPMAANRGCGAGRTPARKGARKKEIQVTPHQALPRLCEGGFPLPRGFALYRVRLNSLRVRQRPPRLAALAGPAPGQHQLQPQPRPTPSCKQLQKARLSRWPWGKGGQK